MRGVQLPWGDHQPQRAVRQSTTPGPGAATPVYLDICSSGGPQSGGHYAALPCSQYRSTNTPPARPASLKQTYESPLYQSTVRNVIKADKNTLHRTLNPHETFPS